MSDHPHGPCECRDGCGCAAFPGPAAFEVTRDDGRVLKVCTRCDLSRDTSRKLLVTADEPCDVYGAYDSLGLFSIVGMLSGALPKERKKRGDS